MEKKRQKWRKRIGMTAVIFMLMTNTKTIALAGDVENTFADAQMVGRDQAEWIRNAQSNPESASLLGTVVLTQLGEGQDSMKETAYRLEKRAGQVWDVVDTYKANEEGNIEVKGLPEGEYRFMQESVPNGYGANETPIGFAVDENYMAKLFVQAYRLPGEPNITPDKESASQGEEVRWTILPAVPADITAYTKYMVTDTLDSRLTYLRTQVMLNDEDITSQIGLSYTNRKVTVAFPQIIYENMKEKTLKIIVETTINSSATEKMEDISNQVELTFNNGAGKDRSESGNQRSADVSKTPLPGGAASVHESKKTERAFSDRESAGTLLFIIAGFVLCGGATAALEYRSRKYMIRRRRRDQLMSGKIIVMGAGKAAGRVGRM